MFAVLLLSFLFLPNKIQRANDKSLPTSEKIKFFKSVIDTLIIRGVDSSFIYSIVNNKSTQFNERYVKINVTGYLKKTDYSHNYNSVSVRKSREFLKENMKLLKRAEDRFSVPSEVITAILWVETKFGSYLGNHHLVSVFLSTALSSKYEFVRLNMNEINNNNTLDSIAKDTLKQKLLLRSKRKSDWALEQLIYLDSARKKLPVNVTTLKGSWAGAFGLSQFLPSSYVRWAVDGDNDGIIDLFKLEDAVFSVANYLKSNGWSDATKDKHAAVFHYNNSDDYVKAVLTLAGRLR